MLSIEIGNKDTNIIYINKVNTTTELLDKIKYYLDKYNIVLNSEHNEITYANIIKCVLEEILQKEINTAEYIKKHEQLARKILSSKLSSGEITLDDITNNSSDIIQNIKENIDISIDNYFDLCKLNNIPDVKNINDLFSRYSLKSVLLPSIQVYVIKLQNTSNTYSYDSSVNLKQMYGADFTYLINDTLFIFNPTINKNRLNIVSLSIHAELMSIYVKYMLDEDNKATINKNSKDIKNIALIDYTLMTFMYTIRVDIIGNHWLIYQNNEDIEIICLDKMSLFDFSKINYHINNSVILLTPSQCKVKNEIMLKYGFNKNKLTYVDCEYMLAKMYKDLRFENIFQDIINKLCLDNNEKYISKTIFDEYTLYSEPSDKTEFKQLFKICSNIFVDYYLKNMSLNPDFSLYPLVNLCTNNLFHETMFLIDHGNILLNCSTFYINTELLQSNNTKINMRVSILSIYDYTKYISNVDDDCSILYTETIAMQHEYIKHDNVLIICNGLVIMNISSPNMKLLYSNLPVTIQFTDNSVLIVSNDKNVVITAGQDFNDTIYNDYNLTAFVNGNVNNSTNKFVDIDYKSNNLSVYKQ